MDSEIKDFLRAFEESLGIPTFRRLILAKPRSAKAEFQKIVISPVVKEDQLKLKWEKFSATQCFTEMHGTDETLKQVAGQLNAQFREAYLWLDHEKWDLKISKKGKGKILKQKALKQSRGSQKSHDRKKKDWVDDMGLLKALGILNASGRINKNQGGKNRQINRFVELMSHLIRDNVSIANKKTLRVVDMGSGKGYLTFALYNYLVAQDTWKVEMTGVERRADLVAHCNDLAKEMGYEGLSFICSDIAEFDADRVDILVALHACDTATDEALYQGIRGNSDLIVTAPCCHKELRPKLSSEGTEKEILRHGILAERQSEILTDALRALALESAGYKSKVFEFVSNQHTNKNLMVVGTNPGQRDTQQESRDQMEQLMKQYGVKHQKLYDLLFAAP